MSTTVAVMPTAPIIVAMIASSALLCIFVLWFKTSSLAETDGSGC